MSCSATVSSWEGTTQNQDHVSFTQRVLSCEEVGVRLCGEGGVKKMINQGARGVWVSVSVCAHMYLCVCERGEWGSGIQAAR